MEFVLQLKNNIPCGTVSCGFPYLFLNDLDYIGRLIFYGIVLASEGSIYKSKVFKVSFVLVKSTSRSLCWYLEEELSPSTINKSSSNWAGLASFISEPSIREVEL